MSDKLEQIAELQVRKYQDIIGEELAQQILDICQPQWIDVNERLPDKRGDYLAFSRSTTGVAWMFFNTTRNTWTSGDDYITNVTHWMPLPEPPEDKP